MDINNPIGMKSLELRQSPFIMNPFRFAGGTWTFEDDFSGTDDWTDIATNIAVNTTTDVIDYDARRVAAHHATSYDLTTVDNTAWILRYKLIISTMTAGSEASIFYMLMSDSLGDGNSNQDAIGSVVIMHYSGGKDFASRFTDNSGSTESTFTETATAGTYYIELKRESATSATIGIYSNSDYSTLTEEKVMTITSGITALRYIKLTNLNNTASGGANNGTIDDIQFRDGSSVAP
jgi:hypothetical protein